VIEQAWLGFGAQKNFAAAQARHDWILALDADECTLCTARRVDQAALAPLDSTLHDGAAQPLPRSLAPSRRRLPDWNVRLFDRRRARWSNDPVHERCHSGSVGRLEGDLLHASADRSRRT
jgi:hypothetical protein